VYCFIYCLYYLFSIIIVLMFHYSTRLKTTRKKTLSSRKREARQVTLDHIDPMCTLSLSSSYIGLHALISLSKPYTVRILVPYLVSYT
jgi:hypothetical protein